MKSREYRNPRNGLIYWLQDNSVMVRKEGYEEPVESAITAAQFFIMVGNDSLVLID